MEKLIPSTIMDQAKRAHGLTPRPNATQPKREAAARELSAACQLTVTPRASFPKDANTISDRYISPSQL